MRKLISLNYSLIRRQFTSKSNSIWTTNKVRETFINYFTNNHQHKFIPSSSVVPYQDESLLFTNAGMNQFKSIFLGTIDPKSPFSSLSRVVNSQKCIRAGGKHNDLDDVGKDTYHHTFFEMLGTWSFGNYFKEEAIEWAYDLLINKYGLDKERMYVSYFAGDEALGIPCDIEARNIWLKFLPAHRVLPFGSKENFWEMGETGPCGPCSEIHYDLIGNRDAATLVNKDDPTVLEIWNLVFIQFHRELLQGEGTSTLLKPLPSKHVDTGMGLERITSILQNKTSNYDIDIFQPIFDHIYNNAKDTGTPPYSGKVGLEDKTNGYKDMAYRAVADHIRALCIAITDGAIPSNEKRGYVIRRILRRALRHCLVLNTSTGYLATLVPTVINTLSASYPELLEKERYIQDIINEEEKSFSVLLPRGVKYIHELLENEEPTNTSKTISGEHAFYLYDTLGFPIDLTQLILEEKGYKVNMNEFESLMSAQKAKSREKPKSLGNESEFSSMKLGIEQIAYLQKAEVPPTNDEWKYFTSIPVEFSAKIKALVNSSGEIIVNPSIVPLHLHGNFGVILDNTPFYSESGGQISDIGTLEISSFDGRSHVLKVVDVQSCGPYVIHTCVFPSHEIASSDIFSCDSVTCSVDYVRRSAISANHTMTHLLNFALREVLSPNSVSPIDQKGSLVSDDKLRFDFSYSKSLTKTEIEEIERRLNNIIQQSLKVSSDFTSLRQITDINGVRAVFGENYPDPVRVVSIGSTLADILANPSRTEWLKLSIELCGGIHLENTADAILFRIIEESSSARGVRRITAVTGDRALETQSNAQRLNQLLTNYQKDLNLTIDANLLSTYTNKLTEFQNLLASQPIPYLDRLEMTNKSNELKKQLQNLTKQYITRDIDKKVKSLALQGKYALEQKLNFEIFILSPNKETPSDEALKQQNAIYQISDSIHIKRITNELNEQFENRLSYLLVIEEEDKITCVSSLQPNAIEKGLSASHWIESLMKSFHGKGGGKQNLANGSLKYDRQSHPFLIDQILGHANELMAQYEMKMNE